MPVKFTTYDKDTGMKITKHVCYYCTCNLQCDVYNYNKKLISESKFL